MQIILSKNIEKPILINDQLLKLSEQFDVFSILNSNNWLLDHYGEYEIMGAFGVAEKIASSTRQNSFSQIRNLHTKKEDWMFGYLSYDLKNEIENLQSENSDFIHAPDMQFFVPQLLVLLKGDKLEVLVHDDYLDDTFIKECITKLTRQNQQNVLPQRAKIDIKHRISKSDYLMAIDNIRRHIKHGDIYELNFCQEFYAENVLINPSSVFQRLIIKSPTPFSAFLRFDDIYIMSASPERFLKKKGPKIISQPIKGTARRKANTILDQKAINSLQNDQKERAENIMIVDLVRNDLAHTAKKNSVVVEELCKIYSFEQVHQMISTISSELDKKYDFTDVLETTFPMGSMTGAPKIRAMQLIEQYESTKRGVFSGAIGYITPNGDFDFNVVIRSLMYNKANKYLSFITGGAITYKSIAETEYEESLLKAEVIRELLS